MPKSIQNKIKRPKAIKILAALYIVAGLALIAMLGIEASLLNTSLNFLNAITIAIISIASITLGYGILSGNGVTLIISSVLIIILIVVQLIQIEAGKLSGVLGVVVCCIVMYGLMRSDVKRLFGFRPHVS